MLLGFSFPDHIDRYLSVLQVARLQTAVDRRAVVYSGEVMFPPGAAVQDHRDPNGTVLRWEDVAFPFRVTVPRDGSAAIDDAVDNPANPLPALDDLLGSFGDVDETEDSSTDYPGFRFRIELMLPSLTFRLGSSWRPAKMGPDHRIVADPELAGRSVAFVLPKAVLEYEQGEDLDRAPDFRIKSWGNSGFDAPSDLAVGEVVRMDPPVAIHSEGRWAFGVDQVMVDFSEGHTPPEILALFGLDESFEGIYIKGLRFHYGDEHQYAFSIGVTDAVISLAGEVSFEAYLDVMGPQVTLKADVELYAGSERRKYRKGRPAETDPTRILGGLGTLLNTGVVHVKVSGGVPPITTTVTLGGADIWDPAKRIAQVSPDAPTTLRPPGEALLVVDVTDAGKDAARQSYHEEILLEVTADETTSATLDGSAADRPVDSERLPQAELQIASVTPARPGYTIDHRPASSGTQERITIVGGEAVDVTVGAESHTTRDILVDVPAGQSVDIVVRYAAVPVPEPTEFRLYFDKGKPHLDHWPRSKDDYLDNEPNPADAPFSQSTEVGVNGHGADAVRSWITDSITSSPKRVTVDAHASFEFVSAAGDDQRLSQRRREVAASIATAAGADVVGGTAHGHTVARGQGRRDDEADRVAILRDVPPPAAPVVDLVATLSRDAASTVPQPPAETPAPPPAPPANAAPDVFRRIGVRVRLIRNVPVLLELSGELDFETAIEERLRSDTPAVAAGEGNLRLEPRPAATANPNPQDGVVDFVLRVTHDPATHAWTEVLALGAHRDDVDGLLRMVNSRESVDATTRLRDAFGSVLLFAPVISASANAIDDGSAGGWVALGGVGGAAALGALGVFEIESVTLYGGELKSRHFIPPSESATFSDASVVFDYGVRFGISIDALGISTSRTLKVRYRAIGFNLHFPGGVDYQPIFDTSRGYELDLSDPGLFDLPSPLGDLLKVLGARIARFNPLTLELDLGLKVDLGVATIDRFLVKWPLDPLGVPSILPSGITVDIPATLAGRGRVEILEPPGPPAPADISSGGIEGSLDLTLVPMKLRVAASVGIRQTPSLGDRTATAVFLGITVDLPTPLPLAASGVGIYGFSGLFAMHYRRDEAERVPGESVSPALKWLVKADGEPASLVGPGGVRLWEPEFDRWSFGVGVMLGTMEGGFLLNLRGMFVLELPGPRILIFVKIVVVETLKDLKPAADLQVGILGVVDLDFEHERFTVGVIVDLEIKDLVQIKLPIEVFFDLEDSRAWHVHIGTFQAPASAQVLNIVRGYGYFMIGGEDINGWPGRGPEPNRQLPGIAVATGVGASVTLGSESVGLYLKVAAGADLGVAFSPYFMAGNIYLDGILRLFIVSIEAHGNLIVEAPEPTFIDGEICGKVSFFFFSVKGCVGLQIGDNARDLRAPELVTNVWLQSHAPVLVAGQGGDRPIDASIGEAVEAGDAAELPVVPIDTVPVMQFHASPLITNTTTFTEDLVPSPLQTPGGWIRVGGDRRVKYELTSLTLSPPVAGERPDATWRRDAGTVPGGAKTNIDLALFSSVPMHGERALERSESLDELVHLEWEGLCDPVAPAVCVLWTFCESPLGPSGNGWIVEGTAAPDPPGTTRSTPAPTTLLVEEPPTAGELGGLLGGLLGHAADQAAMIVRPAGPCGPEHPDEPDVSDAQPDPGVRCVRWIRPAEHSNPMHADFGRVQVFDSNGRSVPQIRITRLGLGSGHAGLEVGHRAEVMLAGAPSPVVRLRLVHDGQPARITAMDASGRTVGKAKMKARAGVSEQIELRGDIHRVAIHAGRGRTMLLEWCAVFKRRPATPFPLPGLPLPTPISTADYKGTGALPASAGDTRERLLGEYLERSSRRRIRGEAPTPGSTEHTLLRDAAHRTRTLRRAGEGHDACCPVLQLPHRVKLRGEAIDADLDPDVVNELGGQRNDQWVTLRTGRATRLRLLIGLDLAVVRARSLSVNQIDRRGAVLRTDRLGDLDRLPITSEADLPAEWMDPAGVWYPQVAATAISLASFANVRRELWTISPEPEADRLQIVLDAGADPRDAPAVLVGVIEACPSEEEDRVSTEQEIRSGRLEDLTGYLSGGAPVTLLEPNTRYELTARYVPTNEDADGHETVETERTQVFRFMTDDEPPRRLDPFVLATTPEHEERFVFYEDSVRIVFNDLTLLQLYGAYGRQLRVRVRAADGVPLPDHDITELDPVAGEYTSPLWEFIGSMIAAGVLPCAGTLDLPSHGSTTVPVPLAPSTAYTLDIEADPPLRRDPDKPEVPLFRRSFRTSRFASVEALVADVASRPIRHRALDGPVTGLPPGAVAVAEDVAVQDALRAAGDVPRPAPYTSAITVYWVPSGTTWRPHAILIDAIEPLWRERYAPRVEVVPGQAAPVDPAFKRIEPGTEEALRLMEYDGNHVLQFVRSPSGTRSLAIIDPSFDISGGGASIKIVAMRPASTLYSITQTSARILDLEFDTTAPWEEEA
jgi:hypothetical protein